MFILNTCAPILPVIDFSRHLNNRLAPFSAVTLSTQNHAPRLIRTPVFVSQAQKLQGEVGIDVDVEVEVEDEDVDVEDKTTSRKAYRGRRSEEGKDYDKDPEFADILGSCLDDPQRAKSKMADRLKNKRDKILHTKTGSATPVKVTFNKFDFSNSYIWFEFYNAPLERDVSLICDAIRAWHIIGRLGGCNSMNMQLSQSHMDKRPSYDVISGANVTPTTFYNTGDLEIQDNLARICFVGIKQLVFGGSEFENWKENLKSEDAGCSVHKI
ncbi:uncharacterized protein LOC102614441 isoform X2 [Citrus sinensis]|uniref:Uncharacterized protein n=1 Tax=Citrus sinensis TaxID=2711 RepID=A0A067F7Z5_CITSI|nr:uncharacterized protein LOC102614441 isoform X2 [Citrus sinensis]KDO59296.1 hypothetical protein CISIN_1g022793mg [Citrus sinensis]